MYGISLALLKSDCLCALAAWSHATGRSKQATWGIIHILLLDELLDRVRGSFTNISTQVTRRTPIQPALDIYYISIVAVIKNICRYSSSY
ncbi:hypothetical protein HDV62DRAFT_349846 [Trichoderma sp. SZMC 28011]